MKFSKIREPTINCTRCCTHILVVFQLNYNKLVSHSGVGMLFVWFIPRYTWFGEWHTADRLTGHENHARHELGMHGWSYCLAARSVALSQKDNWSQLALISPLTARNLPRISMYCGITGYLLCTSISKWGSLQEIDLFVIRLNQ